MYKLSSKLSIWIFENKYIEYKLYGDTSMHESFSSHCVPQTKLGNLLFPVTLVKVSRRDGQS